MKGLQNFAVVGLVGAAGVLSSSANAAVLYENWLYATDAIGDVDGGAQSDLYDMRGIAYRTVGDTAYFAISSSMRPGGTTEFGGALNGRISLGDVFLNFSGHNLDTAAGFNDPLVYGIRFDGTNDSLGSLLSAPNTTLGVFRNLTTATLSVANYGPDTIDGYNTNGSGRTLNAMGDLQSTLGDVSDYLGRYVSVSTNIASGEKIGDINLLDRAALEAVGIDFGHFGSVYDVGGDTVFGFSLNRSLLPEGDFTAHLFEECNNDGTAIRVRGTAAVPEPGTVALLVGMGVSGLSFLARRRK